MPPFANGGQGVSPHVVTRIRTDAARCSMRARRDELGPVIEPRHVAMMNTMMQRDAALGHRAARRELPGWPAAGKTGTSQDFRDAWFVGYTAHLVTGVWLGNDDNSPTRKATGGGLPVEVWTRFMTAAHQGVPVAALPNSQAGGVFSNLMQAASQVSAPPASSAQGPVAPSPMPSGSYRPTPTVPPRRQPSSARTRAAAEFDGWLVDRLFGR